MDDSLQAALAAAGILEELGVRWFLGGSLASSVHGIPRATFDADIMADLRPQHVKPVPSLDVRTFSPNRLASAWLEFCADLRGLFRAHRQKALRCERGPRFRTTAFA